MKEDIHRTLATIESIKKQIKENESTLISVTDSNDLLLTELVGEGVLDEPTKDEILAGKTRSEINRRLLNWLLALDDLSCLNVFLTKLRESGQSHIANLLDETPGELPLKTETRQRIQKAVRELTNKIDADDIAESLFTQLVISADTYEQVKSEHTKVSRAKVLIDSILRGSDRAFEIFEDGVKRSQPELWNVIESTTASDSFPHVSAVEKHLKILHRCTDINLVTIAHLRADKVIDDASVQLLKNESRTNLWRASQVYSWLRIKSTDIFKGFLDVMEKNEQKHVVNLLTNNQNGQQPLSEERFQRLIKACPFLIKGIVSPDELVITMRGKRARDDTDYAISDNDFDSIHCEDRTIIEKNDRLIEAILRRTDFTFECFQEALREAKQSHLADYLTEGEVVGAHVNTTRPEKEDEMCKLWNEQRLQLSADETYQIRDHLLAEGFNELQRNNLCVILTESQHSIMVYTYCKTPSDMKNYVRLLNCGRLQSIYENILNGLLRILEPENCKPLAAAVTLEEEDKMLIQTFTGLEGNQTDVKDLSCISKAFCKEHDLPMNIYCFTCNNVICSSCASNGHHSHRHTENMDADSLRQRLRLDLELMESCKKNSIQLKTRIENGEKSFLKQMEESKVAVNKRCEDLKQQVERFKEMLLRENDVLKERILGDMASRRKAIESYLAVFKNYEEYAECLVERGSSTEIHQSFPELHNRIEKLQLFAFQKNITTADIKELKRSNSETTPAHNEEKTKEFVRHHKNVLEELMDPDFGLLDELRALKVLSASDLHTIATLPTPKDRNSAILEKVLNNRKCRELCHALSATKQTHLVNYINENGVYKPELCDDWPVSNELFNFLNLKRQILALLIDSYDLLSSLCAVEVISVQQKEFISAKPTSLEKTNVLLDLLIRGSSKDLQTALQQVCLQELQVIPFARSFLEKYMFLDFELIEKPFSLTKKQLKAIKNERTRQKKNAKFLNIIFETGNYQQLFVTLRNTNQLHIVNFLQSSGVYYSGFGGDWPFAEDEILMANWTYLVENLKSRYLLEKLQSAKVITKQQEETIDAIHSYKTRNEELLDIVKHGSLSSYKKMVECLRATDQGNIANILAQSPYLNQVQGPVNVQVQVSVSDSSQEVNKLVSSFNDLLATRYFGNLVVAF